MTNNKSPLNGKTYEELFGVEKARQIKQTMSEARKKGIEEGRIKVWNSGLHVQTNTGRTHFKSGQKFSEEHLHNLRGRSPYNKGTVKKEIKHFIEDNTNKHLCKCGCGQFIIIKKFHYNQGIPSYSWRHGKKGENSHLFGREPPNKGKSMVHRGTFKIGHSPSKEIKEKMSETRKGLYQEGKLIIWNKGITGQGSHSWKGGLSNKPYTYDFSKRFKKVIKERDGYCCKLCNLLEEDHLKLYKRRIFIHHIDYTKKNSFFQNCVTLCIRCNSIVNFNRPHWTTFFQSMLKEQYGYQYTQDQKIILDFTNLEISKQDMEAKTNEKN